MNFCEPGIALFFITEGRVAWDTGLDSLVNRVSCNHFVGVAVLVDCSKKKQGFRESGLQSTRASAGMESFLVFKVWLHPWLAFQMEILRFCLFLER